MSQTARQKHSLWQGLLSLAALALGLVLGLLVPQFFDPIAFLGETYVRLLKLLVIPLLMAQVSVGVFRSAGRFAGRLARTVLLFIAMFLVSYCLMAALVSLTGPGRGVDLFGDAWDGELAAMSLSEFFAAVIPDNLFAAMSSGSLLPCILVSFALGIAAASVKAKRAMAVVEEFGAVFSRLLDYVMWLTPVGVFSLIGSAAAGYGSALAGAALRYILYAWGGCLMIFLLVMVIPVWIGAGIGPWTFIRRVGRVWLVSLSTCSSAATLPHTTRVCRDEFGVPDDVTELVVPLGCTINMCGGAVSFCLLGLFTMQMAALPVTGGQFVYMLLLALLMNMAAPGIPGGGIVLGATYLTLLGAPTGFIGLYSGMYRLLDMIYTTMNVTGDIAANCLLAAGENRRAKRRGA